MCEISSFLNLRHDIAKKWLFFDVLSKIHFLFINFEKLKRQEIEQNGRWIQMPIIFRLEKLHVG